MPILISRLLSFLVDLGLLSMMGLLGLLLGAACFGRVGGPVGAGGAVLGLFFIAIAVSLAACLMAVHASVYGASPGQRLLGIKVFLAGGGPPSAAYTCAHWAMTWLIPAVIVGGMIAAWRMDNHWRERQRTRLEANPSWAKRLAEINDQDADIDQRRMTFSGTAEEHARLYLDQRNNQDARIFLIKERDRALDGGLFFYRRFLSESEKNRVNFFLAVLVIYFLAVGTRLALKGATFVDALMGARVGPVLH